MSYHPYIVNNKFIDGSMRQDMEFGNPEAYADDLNNIYVVVNSEFECIYCAKNGESVDGNIKSSLHIATRKEIIDAGLWDYVINKDNYSSESDEIETKLDEYLRIGEKLVKESKQNL